MVLPQGWSCHGVGQGLGGLLAHRGLCCSTKSSHPCRNPDALLLQSSWIIHWLPGPGAEAHGARQCWGVAPLLAGNPGFLPSSSAWRRLPRANHTSLSKSRAPAGNSPLGSALRDPSGKGRAREAMGWGSVSLQGGQWHQSLTHTLLCR